MLQRQKQNSCNDDNFLRKDNKPHEHIERNVKYNNVISLYLFLFA